MKLYNSLTRKLEEFVPIKKGEVGMYSCGPTVYWNQHIGHMYAFVQWDCLVRALKHLGYKVFWVMNITDVGHLVSDEDVGEDKMEKGAKREGLTVWEVAEKYISQFRESLKLLGVADPNVICRATEHVKDQIEMVKVLMDKGFAYDTPEAIYFDVDKFPDYWKFSGQKLEDKLTGVREDVVEGEHKKNPADFALWVKLYGVHKNHVMQWDSPWGKGFPGWHIECTAMSIKYLGNKFDIHTGGKEHIPVHHTNEIAQACGALGEQTANYWLHNDWLTFEGEKMSKSLGNNVLATDLIEKGYDPLDLRYLILSSHYRHGLNFSFGSLDGARTARKKLVSFFQSLEGEELIPGSYSIQAQGLENDFRVALENDLNMPQALAVVWNVVKNSEISDGEKKGLLLGFDQILGLKLMESLMVGKVEIPKKIKKLVDQREKFKGEKKYLEADEMRERIEKEGYLVKDTASGTVVFK